MKVSVAHGEYSKGVIFKTKFYTVTTTVTFNAEELAVIKQRKLGNDAIMMRNPPVGAKVTQVTGVLSAGKILAGLGKTENGFNLTIGDLVKGPDVYTLETPLEAKHYENELMDNLKKCKDYIMGNATTATGGTIEL